MDRFDPFVKYADVYGDIINWEKDPMNKPQNQNKYFFSDGKTYYEQICKMLRLMSVFKEAFNQIYSNEDEISEAWENFVNNLSASVVEGSEPDVTLTWTDDSVNFEFTMVPGVPGEQGVGITSISFNSDYTMTITLSDGNTYTSMSLKGETGPQGPQGETGSGLQILDVYATLADLQSAHPTGQPGDAYQVGSGGNYILYIWSSSQSAWVQAGTLGTVSPYTSAPLMDGTASAGSQNLYARGDHVHPSDTSRASQEELNALIKTSQSLIDQSFTYRESPAIQDGLARIDKIKGNTLVWNQLVQNGNFADTNSWDKYNCTLSVSNNVGTVTTTGTSGNIYTPTSLRFAPSNGDKILVCGKMKAGTGTARLRFNIGGTINVTENATTTWQTVANIVTAGSSGIGYAEMFALNNGTAEYKDIMALNLTKMFGAGNEPTTVEEFTSLFPLSYYDYNAGSLLSFNGTGLKTIGKNIVSSFVSNLNIGQYGTALQCEADIKPNTTYTISFIGQSGMSIYPNENLFIAQPWVTMNGQRQSVTLTTKSELPLTQRNDKGWYIFKKGNGSAVTFTTPFEDVQIELGSTASSYEPYTETTTSLPISTYFPTGMKSAGNVYDEEVPNKATTKVGTVTLNGSEDWRYPDSSGNCWIDFNNMPVVTDYTKTMTANVTVAPRRGLMTANSITGYESGTTNYLYFRTADSSQTPENVKAYLQANPVTLNYELKAPIETAVDLDLSFNAYENGTEQLLPVNGSVPSTSPILADMTYMSIDDAMEYILEKLANVPQNTQQILESLEDDVADLQTDVGALKPAVSALQTSVRNINTNIGQLSSTVAGHTASISDIQSDISDINTGLNNLNTGLNDLEDTVTNNISRIGTLETGLTNTDSQVDAIDARVLNLETDLLKIVKKEYDYDSVAGNTNFGVQTGLSQEPGYKIIGIVGSEVQQGEYTSADPWIIVTQAHVHYTSTGGVVLSMMARNVSEYTKTNVRVYLYLLCIKDTQSE